MVFRRPLILILALMSLAGCLGQSTHKVHAAYALLATGSSGETIIYARVIIDPKPNGCPALTNKSGQIEMSRRDNPFGFPVAVCEAIIPFEQAVRVAGSHLTIAAVNKNPTRILVYGDSGCKEKECPSGAAEPFATLAKAGSDLPIDLILHMGDFNYRGTDSTLKIGNDSFKVYDGGDEFPDDPECRLNSPYISQNASDSPNPDNWNNWWLDFFEPAQELLPKAPWIVARGNHELCSRAGPGWFYFLSPSSNLSGAAVAQQSCPNQGSILNPDNEAFSHLVFELPYVVDLESLRIAVLDSATACDNHAPGLTTTLYQDNFDLINQSLASGNTAWFMTHRPIWGLDRIKKDVDTIINKNLQAALAATSVGGLANTVTLALSGHMHRYEVLTFSDGGIPQVIIGTSGVKLNKHDPKGNIDPFTIDGRQAFGNAKDKHGFLDVTYQSDGSWTGTVIKDDGKTLATCSSANPPAKAICELKE